MQKTLTIICFSLLGFCADVLCFRQTLLMRQELNLNFVSILLAQIFIALALIACVLLFARKIKVKQS
ncbi:MAG: hypothetical protein ACR2LT_03720 [Pyrinomonadaceae bacterium]